MKKKNLAFTLAEVLIVIGIIGVVAALTLPNLNHATGDKETVTRVKKIYSTLTEAFDRAQAIYGEVDTWFPNLNCASNRAACSERLGKRVTEFLKVSKDCGISGSGCFIGGTYANGLTGSSVYNSTMHQNDIYEVVLSDGTAVSFTVIADSVDDVVTLNWISMTFDIDGPNKGPYIWGKDLFTFRAYKTNNFVLSAPSCDYTSAGEAPSSLLTGYCASDWILNYDNADYLKIDNTGKCNDSSIILDGVTNTSCH